jgi:prepilin peptidase CpaA
LFSLPANAAPSGRRFSLALLEQLASQADSSRFFKTAQVTSYRMIDALSLAAFAGLLIYAACSDIARLIIPNWVSIALALIFPVAALASGMAPMEVGLHVLFGAAALAVGFFLFSANIVGGGDAKLLAATAVWTGFQSFLLPFMYWTVIAGGVMALVLLAARQFVKAAETNPPFLNHLLKKQNGIPYGVAIMFGGLMAIPSLSFVLAR